VGITVFAALAGIISVAVARAQLTAAAVSYESQVRAELRSLADIAATTPFEQLAAGDFERPRACEVNPESSCFDVLGRQVTADWELALQPDLVPTSTRTPYAAQMTVTAHTDLGTEVVERRQLRNEQLAGIVRLTTAGADYDGPVFLVNDDGETVAGAATTDDVAIFRVPDGDCRPQNPCRTALTADGSTRNGNTTLDHDTADRPVVVDGAGVLDLPVNLLPVVEVVVDIEARNLDGRRAAPPSTGSVCLWASFETLADEHAHGACNDRHPGQVVFDTFTPDPERPELEFALPQRTPMQLAAAPADGHCPLIDGMDPDPADTGNSVAGVCTDYLWGEPTLWSTAGFTPLQATGGDTVYTTNVDGVLHRVHEFTATGAATFDVSSLGDSDGSVEYLVVGGGGGGGSKTWNASGGTAGGGGGGAGGFLTGEKTVAAATLAVDVGAGGLGGGPEDQGGVGTLVGQDGEDSVFGTLTAVGGGGGGGNGAAGDAGDGGSGGGAGSAGRSPGQGTPGQGHAGGVPTGSSGWPRGGGGGASEPGGPGVPGSNGRGGDGGDGLESTITGTATFYAGGGGGSMRSGSQPGGAGGLGGGGQGGQRDDCPPGADSSCSGADDAAESGQPNTGGGGGGQAGNSGNGLGRGGHGGSGTVIVRYPITDTFDLEPGAETTLTLAGTAPQQLAAVWAADETVTDEEPPSGTHGTLDGAELAVAATGFWGEPLWASPRDCTDPEGCSSPEDNPDDDCGGAHCNASAEPGPSVLSERRGSAHVAGTTFDGTLGGTVDVDFDLLLRHQNGSNVTLRVLDAGRQSGTELTAVDPDPPDSSDDEDSSDNGDDPEPDPKLVLSDGSIVGEDLDAGTTVAFTYSLPADSGRDTLRFEADDGDGNSYLLTFTIADEHGDPHPREARLGPVTVRQQSTADRTVRVIGDNGEPLAGVELQLSGLPDGSSALLADDGEGIYTATIAAGNTRADTSTVTAVAQAPEGEVTLDSAPLTVEAATAQLTLNADTTVTQGDFGTLGGTALDYAGDPVEGQQVQFDVQRSSELARGLYANPVSCTTDAVGTCSTQLTAEAAAAPGAYVVIASAGDVNDQQDVDVAPQAADVSTDPATLLPGTDTAVQLRIQDASGIPVADEVATVSTPGGITAEVDGPTGSDGTAEITVTVDGNVTPGIYELDVTTVHADGQLLVEVLTPSVSIEDTELTIAQGGAADVEIQVLDLEGAPAASENIEFVVGSVQLATPSRLLSDEDGTIIVGVSAAADIDVTGAGSPIEIAVKHNGAQAATIETTVVAGATNIAVDGPLTRGAVETVTLTLTDVDGQPVTGREVAIDTSGTGLGYVDGSPTCPQPAAATLCSAADGTVTVDLEAAEQLASGRHNFLLRVDGRTERISVEVN